MFNESGYYERMLAGQLMALTVYSRPAPQTANQRPGTMSELVDYWDGSTRVARVHQYRRPDDSLGGHGRPDPKSIHEGGVLYYVT